MIGVSPSNAEHLSDHAGYCADYDAACSAITTALKVADIDAEIVYMLRPPEHEFDSAQPTDEPNWFKSTLSQYRLADWLNRKGVVGHNLCDGDTPSEAYLNSTHPCYAPKLAAGVHAWCAVTNDERYVGNGKSAKQNLEAWLTANAAAYGLVNETGDIRKDTISNQIAKVANWDDKGGAPKTPVRKPKPAEPDEKGFSGPEPF